MSALRRQAPPAAAALEAKVAGLDPLTVTIDGFDGDEQTKHLWEAGVIPIFDRLPALGDRCLVTFADTGALWVLVGIWTGRAP